jgi:hypothetical protein
MNANAITLVNVDSSTAIDSQGTMRGLKGVKYAYLKSPQIEIYVIF